jgi:hypothetical protein
VPMSWYPELAELLRVISIVVAMFLVVAGAMLLTHSSQSAPAAMHSAIFFGIAAALGWATDKRKKFS